MPFLLVDTFYFCPLDMDREEEEHSVVYFDAWFTAPENEVLVS